MQERGPYVYREEEMKIDVNFQSNLVNFHLWRRQTFDAKATRSQCGRDCTEDDKVKLLILPIKCRY